MDILRQLSRLACFAATTAAMIGLPASAGAASLQKFFPTVLRFEGGYSVDPADPGSGQNKGVTHSMFMRFAKPVLGIDPSPENLRRLSDEHAYRILKGALWDPLHGDEIPDQLLAEMIFDFSLTNRSAAVHTLHTTLNGMGIAPPLNVVGDYDQNTFAAMARANPVELYRRYKAARRAYYIDLVAHRPELAKYLKGWLRRTDAFPDR